MFRYEGNTENGSAHRFPPLRLGNFFSGRPPPPGGGGGAAPIVNSVFPPAPAGGKGVVPENGLGEPVPPVFVAPCANEKAPGCEEGSPVLDVAGDAG